MRDVPHPNNLRMLLRREGLTQREIAREAGIPEGTLQHYVAGEQVIPRKDRIKLAQIIGCETQDLAPQYDADIKTPNELRSRPRMIDGKKPLPVLESDGFFHFGKRETALVVLDGNGVETYSSQDIRTFYDARPVQFFEEIEQTREHIKREQADLERGEKLIQWNGEIYHLATYQLSRDPIHEQMKLHLWFRPTDYFTVLAKNRCLKDRTFREKHITGYDWDIPFPSLPIPFGIGLSLVTSDGYILFAQREGNLGVRPSYFMTSVEEGLSRPLDRGTSSDAPDVYRCACRGLAEELGLIENTDFSLSDIRFLGLGLDTEYYMCGLRGFMKVTKTARDIINNWQLGVKDKMENKKLVAIPFTPKDVCDFVFSRGPWGGGALMGIYHTLVHEFGKDYVNDVISSY